MKEDITVLPHGRVLIAEVVYRAKTRTIDTPRKDETGTSRGLTIYHIGQYKCRVVTTQLFNLHGVLGVLLPGVRILLLRLPYLLVRGETTSLVVKTFSMDPEA